MSARNSVILRRKICFTFVMGKKIIANSYCKHSLAIKIFQEEIEVLFIDKKQLTIYKFLTNLSASRRSFFKEVNDKEKLDKIP